MPLADNSWAQTRDINLAAALASFTEVEIADQLPVQSFHDHERGEEYSVFKFKITPKVHEIMRLWADPQLLDKHPEHPVAYMKAFVHNRNRYLDCVKSNAVWHIVKKGSRIYFIPKERNG